jgi:hypothetical protein
MKFSIITIFLAIAFALVVVAMPGRGDHSVPKRPGQAGFA